jgi:PHD/YefM family antitoxin component YafN of YafNO toxin-antitoxin module
MRREQKRAMRLRREARRGMGVPRFPLPRRWRDTTTMLLSNPKGAKALLEAIAQLDRWAARREARCETLRGEVAQRRAGGRRRARSVGNRGLRRALLPVRWQDETAYLLSNPANAKWIRDSLAELDSWRAHREAVSAARRLEADASQG